MMLARLKNLCLVLVVLLFLPIACQKEGTNQHTTAENETIAMLDALIRKDGKNANLYYRRSKLYFSEGSINEALQDIQRAIAQDGKNPSYYIFQADLHFRIDQSAMAFKDLQQALAIDNTNIEAYLKTAELALFLKDYDKTMENVNKAIEIDKINATSYFLRGWALKEKGDTVHAVADYKRAVALNPEYEQAQEELGILYALKHDPLAIDYLNTTMTLNPKNTQALYALGLYYQEVGDYPNALETYRRILNIQPAHADALHNIGYINFVFKNDVQEALVFFDQAVQADSTFVEAYFNRGVAYEKVGQKNSALADFKHVLSLNPHHFMARNRLKANGVTVAVPPSK